MERRDVRGRQLVQRGVLGVLEPGLDEDAVLGLQLEVLGDVVDDDRLRKVAAELRDVLR